jgi:3-hydroxyisobutyrate dehydrogenase
MLSDAEGVADAVGGENGPLPVLAEGGVWLQTSTVGAEGSDRLEELAAGRGGGGGGGAEVRERKSY